MRDGAGLVAVALALALAVGCGKVSTDEQLRDASIDAGAFDCDSDLSQVPPGSDVSFVDDVLPVFAVSCTQSACHGADRPKANLYLGPRCMLPGGFDPEDPLAMRCEYTASSGSSEPLALTETIVQEVLGNLVNVPSQTAPAVARVSPGDPQNSFLVHKIAGTHADQGFDCQPLEGAFPNSYEESPCGESMPAAGQPLFCESWPGSFTEVLQWIAQGADHSPCEPDDTECRSLAGDCCGGDTCIDLTTAENCGTCGNRCQGGQVCIDGGCACREGLLWCEDQCVASGVRNCGACGVQCRESEECVDGECACPFEGIFCDGLCRIYDENHCGACGVVCPPGTECDPGSFECRCPSPLTLCGQECIDASVDPAHCGACNQACAPSESCIRGSCSTVSTTCGAETCDSLDVLGTFFLSACCPSNGGCGIDLSNRYPGGAYPDVLPACVPQYTPGVDDPSCPSDYAFFPPCCSEGGRCGLWLTNDPDVGCIEAIDSVPCTAQ